MPYRFGKFAKWAKMLFPIKKYFLQSVFFLNIFIIFAVENKKFCVQAKLTKIYLLITFCLVGLHPERQRVFLYLNFKKMENLIAAAPKIYDALWKNCNEKAEELCLNVAEIFANHSHANPKDFKEYFKKEPIIIKAAVEKLIEIAINVTEKQSSIEIYKEIKKIIFEIRKQL